MLRPMKTSMVSALVVGLGSTLLVVGAARAGVTMVIQRGKGAEASQSTVYIEGERLRAESGAKQGHDTDVIMDGKARKMIMIKPSERSYTEMTEADMKKMKGQVDAMRAQAAERMKNLPPEQRKQMEKMMAGMGMGDGKVPKLDFKPMGQKKTVNGFACDMYSVLKDGVPTEEDCVAPWGAKVLQKSDIEGFRKFAEDMAKNLGMSGQNEMFQQFEKYPGLPITRHILDGSMPDEEIKSIKRGSIPESQFAVPAGYTKKDLPAMGGPGMGGPGHHGGPAPKP
jgi:hypothetical protein